MVLINMLYLGNPKPNVRWKKDGREIKPKKKDKRFLISWDINNDLNTLEIKDAEVEDSGVYIVEATNSLGTVQSTVTVIVQPTEQPKAEPMNEAVCVEEISTQESAVEQVIESGTEEKVVEVTIQPAILIKPEDIEVTPGETVKISCKITG